MIFGQMSLILAWKVLEKLVIVDTSYGNMANSGVATGELYPHVQCGQSGMPSQQAINNIWDTIKALKPENNNNDGNSRMTAFIFCCVFKTFINFIIFMYITVNHIA